jgi:arylsulfatase A-like enzyme
MKFPPRFLPVITLTGMICLTCMMTGCGSKSNSEQEAGPYNFLLVYTDELQFSDLGCYGGAIPTPNIDQLARKGLMFTAAYTSASMCTPSRYSVLTGQFPGRCSAPSFLDENPVDEPYNIAWNSWITEDKQTLAKILGTHGYVTGMAGKWHVGRVPEGTQLPRFNPDDRPENEAVDQKLREQQSIYQALVREQAGFDRAYSVVWSNYDNHPVEALRFHNFPWMISGAVRFLEEQKESDAPFFLYFAPTAIHGPNHEEDLERDVTLTLGGRDPGVLDYQLDVEALKSKLQSVPVGERHRYSGIVQTDHAVGLIRQKLEELGMDDRTVIIFISDHNIEPGKATSYEKGIHVPMIVYWPGITSGGESSAQVQNLDIYPTLLEEAGIALPLDYRLDGQSMMKVIRKPSLPGKPLIFSENGYTRSVSDGRYKYIALRYPQRLIEAMQSGELGYVPSYVEAWPQAHSAIAMQCYPHYFDQDQLYDLESDPYEQYNIFGTESGQAVIEPLRTAMEAHLETFDHPFPLAPIPFMQTPQYRLLAETDLAFDIYTIPWLNRDHGTIVWPPTGDE